LSRYTSNAQRPEFHIIVKFDTHAHLRSWLDSDVRRIWLARAATHQAAPPAIEVLTGLETWFSLPGQPSLPLPPRWKMCAASWLAIFPLITMFRAALAPVLDGLPTPLQSLVLTLLLTPTMTYAAMPWMTRRLRRWLYPAPDRV